MTRFLAALALVLCLAHAAQAQVAIDAVTSQGVTATTNTISHTVAGSNRAMVIACSIGNSATVSTATYNAVSLTLVAKDGVDGYGTEIWKLTAPATGTNNAVITISSADAQQCTVVSLTGVDQGTSFGTAVADHYTAAGLFHNHNTNSQTSGLVVDAFTLAFAGGTTTSDAGQTNRAGPTAFGSDFIYAVSTEPGATTVATGYSWVNDFNRWSHVTVPVLPVGAAAGSCVRSLLGVGC